MIDQEFDVKPYESELKLWSDWNDPGAKDFKDAAKKFYFKKQNEKCCYCRRDPRSSHGMENDLEHIVSRDENPKFTFVSKNLAIACKKCNGKKWNTPVLNSKSNSYPLSGEGFKIYHPHYDKYDEHIFVAGGRIYSAISEKGTFTISVCKLWELNKKTINDMDLIDYYDPLVEEVENLLECDSETSKKTAMRAIVGIIFAAASRI